MQDSVRRDPLQLVLNVIGNHAKWLVIAIGCLSFTLLSLFMVGGPTFGSLDESWVVALPALLQQGQLMGRDSYFTYGPLSQVIYWIGSKFNPTGSALAALPFVVLAFWVFGFVVLGAILLLFRSLDWKRTALLFPIILVFGELGLLTRPFLLTLCALLVGSALSLSERKQRLRGAIFAGLVIVCSELITVDVGLYAIVAAVIILVLFAVAARFRLFFRNAKLLPYREYLYILIAVLTVFIAGNLLIDTIFALTSRNYHFFDYQRLSLDVIRGYGNAMSVTWSLSGIQTVFLFLFIIYTVTRTLIDLQHLPTADSYLIFSFLVVAVIQLRSMVTRSDLGHIMFAIIPLSLLFLIVEFLPQTSDRQRFRGLGYAVFICFIAIWPTVGLDDLKRAPQLIANSRDISAQLRKDRSITVDPNSMLSAEVLQKSDSTKTLLSFPYLNAIPIGLNRSMVAPVLQAYSAHTESLERMYVEALERQRNNLEIVYGIDGEVTGGVDQVQTITRTPIIFDYIYRNFEARSPATPGVPFILLGARSQPRADMQNTALSFTTAGTNPLTIKLTQPADCSLIRLTLTVSYPITTLLGRPNPLTATVSLADQEVATGNLVFGDPGKSTYTYLSIFDPVQFPTIFGPNPVPTQTWDTLKLEEFRTGIFAVSPRSINIEKLECVTFKRDDLLYAVSIPLHDLPLIPITSQPATHYQQQQIGGENKTVLFQQAPSRLYITPTLPQDSYITFKAAIYVDPDNVTQHPELPQDGVLFRLSIDNAAGEREILYENTFDPNVDDAPSPLEVDLSAYAGQTIHLEFETDPRNNPNYDWAMWVDPHIDANPIF